jgi:hypothetical protein
MSPTDWLSAVSAAFGAVAGVFAAVAANRSARAAQLTHEIAADIECRSRLRELTATVAQITFEHTRLQALAMRLQRSYRHLAVFDGGLGGSRLKLSENQVADRMNEASECLERAHPFMIGTHHLSKAPPEDVDRVLGNLFAALAKLQALAAESERDLDTLEAQLLQRTELAPILARKT